MYRIKAAIIGTGQMGRAHLQSLRRIGVQLNGVLGSSPQKGQTFADENGIPRAYTDLEELLSDTSVQVVHVCTPNNSHFHLAKAVLDSGRHVILEKPIAMDAHESRRLFELSQKKQLAAVTNHNFRFFPMTLEAHALAGEGKLGNIRMIQGGYYQGWLFPPERWDWRLLPGYGGAARTIGDIGSHWLDMIAWITGLEVVEVSARSAIFTPERINPETGKPVKIETEDAAVVAARYSNGALASVALSQSNPGRENHFWFELTGSQQSLLWDQEHSEQLEMGSYEQGKHRWQMNTGPLHEEVQKIITLPDGQVKDYLDTFPALHRLVYDALEADRLPDASLVPTFRDGHRDMVLVDAIHQATRSQSWIKIPQDWGS